MNMTTPRSRWPSGTTIFDQWCYIGLERVDNLAKEFNIEVEGKAYLLRPDTPREGAERPARPGETAAYAWPG